MNLDHVIPDDGRTVRRLMMDLTSDIFGCIQAVYILPPIAFGIMAFMGAEVMVPDQYGIAAIAASTFAYSLFFIMVHSIAAWALFDRHYLIAALSILSAVAVFGAFGLLARDADRGMVIAVWSILPNAVMHGCIAALALFFHFLNRRRPDG